MNDSSISPRINMDTSSQKGQRIPLSVKIAFTLFMAVLVPFYGAAYGPTNFLYFCDMSLFFTLAALWLESPLLASMPAVGLVLPQMLWVLDFCGALVGHPLTGMTDYMFRNSLNIFARALSLFHGWLPFLLVWMVYRLGYDRRALVAWTVLAWGLMLVCYFFMPAPPPPAHNPDMPVNINYVYGLSDDHAQTWMAPQLWFALLLVGLPLGIFLPSHLLFRKLFRPADEKFIDSLRLGMWKLTRFVLGLRYRVQVHGMEKLADVRGPVLILPSHPAYIDPSIVLSNLWPVVRPRPMLFENLFKNPLLYPLMKFLDALRIPDLEKASFKAKAKAEEALSDAIESLKAGESVILWPSGRVQRDGRGERLGGSRSVSEILQAVPQTTVVLVRTRGLWGSRFGYAWSGERPNLLRVAVTGAGWLVANLLFFTPRRKVDITVEVMDQQALSDPRREVINPWLENWLNQGGPEKPQFVPYHRLFGARSHDYPTIEYRFDLDMSKVKPETKAAVAEILSDRLERQLTTEELSPDTTLDQLGLDSLDRMDLALHVEQRFGFISDEAPATVGELLGLAQGLVERGPQKAAPPEWFRRSSERGPLEIWGDTIPEAFVIRALAYPKDVAVADDMAGVLTYERMLIGALAMSRRFAQISAPNVGLMLPSAVAADTALLALYLAGKLPVMLNWTTGPGNLAHAAKNMQLTHVVTSKAFIDRSGVKVEGVKYLFLEDVRRGIGKLELLRLLLTVRLFPGHIRKQIPHIAPDQTAVVLFTSGSERAPKAVPLTHRNMLLCQRGGIVALGLTRQDSILGFLPAFHSFGIAATLLLPILGGMPIVHHPDPTDAAVLAHKITAYRPTVLMGTPTFISYILNRVKPGELDSLRLISVGAEKCPPALFEQCARLAPQACLLEGYGITECSPVVAVNRRDANRPGSLGQPLAGVEVCIVDLDDDRTLGVNQQGMILVSGPTVFPGYLGFDGPSPFRERDGKRWYVTGDLGRRDEDGYIWFGGRLKRFLKAGGEMISLPALEEPFAQKFPPTSDGPRVAVEGVETEHGRRIVLFSTEALTLKEANAHLQEAGFRGVMRLDEVRRLDAIPVLGTGKVDYKVLRSQVTEVERAMAAANPP
jgi:acyl-CoA synthetase (AMP-forming)/AMP-acid ligase II/1-acyl-sn-glycerol-3-phosphate acyltransferase/acyl carrier protein